MEKQNKLKLEFVSLSNEKISLNQIISCSGCDCNNNDGCNYDTEYLDDLFIENAPAFTFGDFMDDMHMIPTDEHKKNIQILASSILQPVFDHFKRPVIIKSAIRMNEAERPIEGVQVDLHSVGLAVDFNVKNIDTVEVMKFIQDNCTFHEMVLCKAGSKRTYIHLSLSLSDDNNKSIYAVENRSRKCIEAKLE